MSWPACCTIERYRKMDEIRILDIIQTFNRGKNIMNRQADRSDRRRVLSASSLKGTSVRNLEGQDLGKIEEIMLDHSSGQVAYAVLSFGGFLGMGDKLFAIPWDTLRLETERDEFILPVAQEVLESAPGFDKDNWPDFADPSWGGQVHKHYDSQPYWERQQIQQQPPRH